MSGKGGIQTKRVHYVVRHQKAGREGFEPSRELYTPYPLSRRVLSATQPPPRIRRGRFNCIRTHALLITSTPVKTPTGQVAPPRGGRGAMRRAERSPG